jgi:exopolyphosphatase/guanosine-5'-triphosphate,3'-diphosphate pyrophosphatase
MEGEPKAAVDIGTNSMRLLVVDAAGGEIGRWQRVTGLGLGVDSTGRLSPDAIERTVDVLALYGELMRSNGVVRARAVATSASRDAANRDEFFDRAERALGLRPELIEGVEEAALSFAGATLDAPGDGPFVVSDIGGGSTELVYRVDGAVTGMSVDIGSVRLTERLLPDHPADFDQLEAAGRLVDELLANANVPTDDAVVIGVAGTWTSLAAISLGLAAYDREAVHHAALSRDVVDHLVLWLAALDVDETAAIPALDPARAPVILAGAVVARGVMRRLAAGEVIVSEHDLLDGVVASL